MEKTLLVFLPMKKPLARPLALRLRLRTLPLTAAWAPAAKKSPPSGASHRLLSRSLGADVNQLPLAGVGGQNLRQLALRPIGLRLAGAALLPTRHGVQNAKKGTRATALVARLGGPLRRAARRHVVAHTKIHGATLPPMPFPFKPLRRKVIPD